MSNTTNMPVVLIPIGRRAHSGRVSRGDTDLVWVMNNNLGAASISRYGSAQLYLPTAQGAEVTELASVGRKYDARKWAIAIVLAEVQESIPGSRGVNFQHPAFDATCFPYARAGFAEIDASLNPPLNSCLKRRDGRMGSPHSASVRHDGTEGRRKHYDDGDEEELLAGHFVTRSGPRLDLEQTHRVSCREGRRDL
jgi:hypothetical protein